MPDCAGSTDLLVALRDGSLPPSAFNHASHLHAAWLTLRQQPLPQAAHGFSDLLLAYVRQVGAEDKFHLTLTHAFLHLVQQRMLDRPGDWASFVASNHDLFEDARRLIARHYSDGCLSSPEARQRFVPPDRLPLP